MNNPEITVLMSVYNTGEEYLRTSIESILSQTFDDFEFLIYDDASDEATKAVLASYTDDRIIIRTNDVNEGLTKNLNKGILEARGKYIARMDADDISYPERLRKCLEYMEKNTHTDILGTFVNKGGKVQKSAFKLTTEYRKALCMIENPGPFHPSVMFRKSFFTEKAIRYDELFKKAQDFELWARCLDKGIPLYILPEVLVEYRVHEGQISTSGRSEQDRYADLVKSRMIKKTGIEKNDDCIMAFIDSRLNGNMEYNEYKGFIDDMISSNRITGYYKENAIKFVGDWYLFKYIKNSYTGIRKWMKLMRFMLEHDGITFIRNMIKAGAE